MHFLIIAAGGAIGACLRHLTGLTVLRFLGVDFPVGLATLIVNVLGSFLMGACVAFLALKYQGGAETRLFLVTGLLGGFTTFSSFSLDAALLLERGAVLFASGYVAASVIMSLLAFFIGQALVRSFA